MKEIKQLEKYYKEEEFDLEAIIEDFTPYITTIINNGTNNKLSFEDKEEIFADTFFILWKNKENINIKVSLNSYLAGITRNLIKEKYRKLNYEITNYENEFIDSINLYENERDCLYDIEEKIMKLKKIDREIFKLFYYSSKPIKDIAKILNISDLNVKTKLHRIRKKIKSELRKDGRK